jgi:hypothetical protein
MDYKNLFESVFENDASRDQLHRRRVRDSVDHALEHGRVLLQLGLDHGRPNSEIVEPEKKENKFLLPDHYGAGRN